MKLLTEVRLGPRTNGFNFGNDPPDYNPDLDYDLDRTDLHETFTRGVHQAKKQSSNFKEGLQCLTDCLVLNDIVTEKHTQCTHRSKRLDRHYYS